jgi:hypothetical protein
MMASARAQEPQADRDAREQEARRECSAGRYQRGVDVLAALYAETSESIYVYNQGRCYEENNRLEQAVARFREYERKLERTPDTAAEIAELDARINGLEDRIARARAVTMTLQAPPPAPAPPPEKSLLRKSWFWVAVGAVAAGSVTAVLLATRSTAYQSPRCPDCNLSVAGVPTR